MQEVSIGHAVGVLLPALYWGDKYQMHFAMEAKLSTMPIAFLWNAPSAMICFLVLSGFVTPLKTFANSEKQSIFGKCGGRYLRLMPMALIGILLGWLVMKLGFVYGGKIVDLSYSYGYGNGFNNFDPGSLLAADGPVWEGIYGLFVKGSRFNSPLTTIRYIFWNGLLLQVYAKFTFEKKWRDFLYFVTVIFGIYRGQKVQYEWFYLSAMTLGYWVSDWMNNPNRKKLSMNAQIRYYAGVMELVISGFLLVSPYTEMGRHIHGLIMGGTLSYTLYFMLGWTMLVLSLDKLFIIRKMLETKAFQFIGRHSFAYYAVHWPIIISGTCILALVLFRCTGMTYAKAAVVSIVISIPIVLGLAFFIDNWIYPYTLKRARYVYEKLSGKE